jgi:hypothetical protein
VLVAWIDTAASMSEYHDCGGAGWNDQFTG